MRLSAKAAVDARQRAQDDLYFLVTEILQWGGSEGGPPVEPSFHKPLCRWIEASDVAPGGRVGATRMLLWPRGYGKTTFFTIADSIRMALRYPGVCQAIGHAQLDDACKIVLAIRAEFEHKPLLQQIAPDVCYADPNQSPLWNRDAFVLRRKHPNKTPSFVATSPEAMPTGMHFHIWNFDDLVTFENSRTALQRDRCKDAMQLVHPFLPDRMLCYKKIAGTRWHLDDTYGDLERIAEKTGSVVATPVGKRILAPGYDILKSGMLDPSGVPWLKALHCIQREGPNDKRRTIAEIREEYGASKFAACMMQEPLPEGSAAFNRDDIVRYDLLGEGETWQPPVDGLSWYFHTSVDLNTQSHTAGDFAVVLTVAKSNRGHLAVVDASRGHPTRWQLVDWIQRHVETWKPKSTFVETVAYQKTFLDDLATRRVETGVDFNVVAVPRGGVKTGAGKNDRIMGLQGVIEARKLWVPRGERFEFLLDEVGEFAPESDSRHDDGLDCLADIHRLGRRPEPPQSKREERSSAALLSDWFLAQTPLDLVEEGSAETTTW